MLEALSSLQLSAVGALVLLGLALICSSYVKLITVFGIVRAGLGVSSVPGSFVCISLALALSLCVMFPTLDQSSQKIRQHIASASGGSEAERIAAFRKGLEPWRQFLQQHAHDEEQTRFAELSIQLAGSAATNASATGVSTVDVVPTDKQVESEQSSWSVLVPAFVVSELKEAFSAGLRIFIPFLVIDLLVVTILVAVGSERIEPMLVSLPFKLALFVVADGWGLLTHNLVATYAGA